MHQKRLLITSRVTNHITFCTRLVSPKNSRPCLAAARSRSLTTGLFCFEGRPLLLETGVGRTKGGVGMERQVCMRMRSSLEAICQHLHQRTQHTRRCHGLGGAGRSATSAAGILPSHQNSTQIENKASPTEDVAISA